MRRVALLLACCAALGACVTTRPPAPSTKWEQRVGELQQAGTWQLEGRDPSYSTMKLKDVGDTVSGVWIADKKTVYVLSGKRDGTHLTLDVASQAKPDTVIGKIDAEIDGIADMVGTITIDKIAIPLNAAPFQAAMHARVPPPPVAIVWMGMAGFRLPSLARW